MDVTIRKQRRRSLALRLTPRGPEILIPAEMDADHPSVQEFIEKALADLPDSPPAIVPMSVESLQQLVAAWAQRIGVQVSRLQVRPMRHKWGSISTAGTLTLADDLRAVPRELAEYVIVHELLHLKFPDHHKAWQVSMSMYIPDWRNRERRLAAWMVSR